ncbi:hypothetical protein Bca4012_051133 [Brassica carinata]
MTAVKTKLLIPLILYQDEIGVECSVLNPTSSSYATTQHHISSSLVIRDLTESITRAHHISLHNPLKRKKKQYIAVKEICDDMSLVTYNLIDAP